MFVRDFPKHSTDVVDFSLQGYDKFFPDNQEDRGVILFIRNAININKVTILDVPYKEAIW